MCRTTVREGSITTGSPSRTNPTSLMSGHIRNGRRCRSIAPSPSLRPRDVQTGYRTQPLTSMEMA
ncbi:unnamed protein product [Symbiodinium microadriaticum]|nr:unnamed protein product [Symbiodinium microadriaticum]